LIKKCWSDVKSGVKVENPRRDFSAIEDSKQ